MNGVSAAIKAAGNKTRLAKLVKVKRQAIQQWEDAGAVPAKRALAVQEATGVSVHDLNPAVFGRKRK